MGVTFLLHPKKLSIIKSGIRLRYKGTLLLKKNRQQPAPISIVLV